MIPREILSKVRHIEIITNRLVDEVMGGSYHSVFKGRGMEFEEVREYMPGDDVRAIDWNVTARTGNPFVKLYREERELTVLLMVDASASSAFGTVNRLKSELTAEVSALLAFSAIKNNDRVGLLIFSDRIEKFIPPKKGVNHVLRVIREVLYCRPQGRGTDLPAAAEHAMKVMRRKSVVFLISDFLAPRLRRPLAVLNKKHDLIALWVSDPREHELPPAGLIPLEDPETGEVVFVDTFRTAFRHRFAASAQALRAETETLFKQLRIDYATLSTDRPYLEPIVGIFRRRASRY
jgi:uncharacterized protein (DUF58 family)